MGVRYNKGVPAPRGPAMTEADFRRMWNDWSIPITEMGRRLGISASAVRYRAISRGLPPRGRDRPWQRTLDRERIVQLYKAGLSMRAVGKVCGTSRGGVASVLRSEGVQRRPRAVQAPVTLNDLPRLVLAAAARKEQAALWLSEMVDGQPPGPGRRRAA